MAENWAVTKTLLQNWKWCDFFSPSLYMDQTYIKTKTKTVCILDNINS